MSRLAVGQRWVSEAEPELGLGVVSGVTGRQVELHFPAAETSRRYALASAPIRRVELQPGDDVETEDGDRFTVAEVLEEEDLRIYCGEGRAVVETRLAGSLRVRGPEERLFGGRADRSASFELRLATLRHLERLRRSPARGFAGARVELLPHQLYVAGEVAGRHRPRALLADEVGLGKTIEAGLVLHRLMTSGRAGRVLVLAPESLVHQWFVELLRRFNTSFRVIDEAHCRALAERDPEANAFLEVQTAICQLAFLARSRPRAQQALAAGWDVVVVDEAHHLHWSPGGASPEYALVERLAERTPGLLLLTATPEQLGLGEHFARLRLLDPDRYHDLESFEEEAERYHEVARVAGRLLDGERLSGSDAKGLRATLGRKGRRLRELVAGAARGDAAAREGLVAELLDRHGPGRVVFRNTRAALSGFPARVARLAPLPAPAPQGLRDELAADVDPSLARPAYDFSDDPRIEWLLALLRRIGDDKVLLICRYREKAEAIAEAIRRRSRVRAAPFHEGLPLLRRDRNAAWFAEPGEAGARLLVASEIGSEGRNFQFAHHLVLFDLPFEPEVLEQRIGRLDRIGQRETIQVHVPWIEASDQRVLVRWYHEGLEAFERSLPSGDFFLERFGAELLALLRERHWDAGERLDALVAETRRFRARLARQLAGGRDRLLELSSYRAGPAEELRAAIRELDDSRALDDYLPRLLEHFGAEVEQLGPRSFLLGQSSGLRVEALPGLRRAEIAVTADRVQALAREDLEFLTWEHPVVAGTMELLTGSQDGNAAVAAWAGAPLDGLLVDAVFVLECVAPPQLFADRFLPPTPVRVLVDHAGRERTAELEAPLGTARLGETDPAAPARDPALQQRVRGALETAREIARERTAALAQSAGRRAREALDREIERLEALRAVDDAVQLREIDLAVEERERLLHAIAGARLRLDAVRVIRARRAGA